MMLKTIGAGIAGVIAAWAVFIVAQLILRMAFPLPEGIDLNDPVALSAYVMSMPAVAFAGLLAGYGLGAFAGGFVASKVAKDSGPVMPVVIGAFLTLGWLGNILTITHPFWVSVVGFFLYIPLATLGHRTGRG